MPDFRAGERVCKTALQKSLSDESGSGKDAGINGIGM